MPRKVLKKDTPHPAVSRIDRLERVAKLATELCDRINVSSYTLGEHRSVTVILEELGPACDALKR